MEKLFETQKIIIDHFENQPFYWKVQFEDMTFNNRICRILGARGIGKTTFLIKHAIDSDAKKRKALYVSAD